MYTVEAEAGAIFLAKRLRFIRLHCDSETSAWVAVDLDFTTSCL